MVIIENARISIHSFLYLTWFPFMRIIQLNVGRFHYASFTLLMAVGCLITCDRTLAFQSNDLLAVFSDSNVANAGNSAFTSTTELDLSGSIFGFGVDENDVYHAALKTNLTSGPANRDWEIRIGQGGQIYSIRSEVGEIVPPQSFRRPFNDEVFQSVSVNTAPRATGGEAAFYHQSGYYVDSNNVTQPTFSPLLSSGSVEANAYSTLSLAVQADAEAIPQLPSGLLHYQRTRDLGDGVIEITHSIYNFGEDTVDFHNLPWGGVRKTVFANMLVSNPGGGFTNRPIDGFGNPTNQVVNAAATGGWAAFTEGTSGTDRGLAYVFGDTDTHLDQPWQNNESSWRWGDGGGDFLGIPIRNFNVGTFRRAINVDPGDLFESRYFLVLGDVDHIESSIGDRDLVFNATYDKRIIHEEDSGLLAWDIIEENETYSVVSVGPDQPSDFLTYTHPVAGSKPLFLFEDSLGNEFISIDPYALSTTPYDRQTKYKGILGFVLPPELINSDTEYVDLASLFQGNGFYLTTTPSVASYVLLGVPDPTVVFLSGDVNQDGVVSFLDISAFILLLSDNDYLLEADVNLDGAVDFLDINPFIDLLASQ